MAQYLGALITSDALCMNIGTRLGKRDWGCHGNVVISSGYKSVIVKSFDMA